MERHVRHRRIPRQAPLARFPFRHPDGRVLGGAARRDVRVADLVRFIGLFAGGLGGLFLLAIFTRRTHATGALLGLLASGVLQLLLRQFYPVHASFYPATGIIFCLVIGYSANIIIPQKQKSIEGLTIFTLSQSADRS